MSPSFPVTHSLPSARSLAAELLPEYDLPTTLECWLHMAGVNDTYLVRTTDARYVLKIYRLGWRSLPNVRYEVDFLLHLQGNGVSVSTPIAARDGRFARELPTPEGDRPAVLFTYAPGKPPSWPFYEDEADAALCGETLASLHTAANGFRSEHFRSPLDLAYLLDRSLEAIQPFMEQRPDDWQDLLRLADRLREQITVLAAGGLTWGICHGDFHCSNLHFDADRRVTVFDFDAGGPGWFVFDLAPFARNTLGKAPAIWNAFLEGYSRRRHLSDPELEAVRLMAGLREIHLLGLRTGGARKGWWDCWWAEFQVPEAITGLREWANQNLG
jgi:Ser/Thr protein kinase RdoA (MazF antagonist)